MKIPVGRWPLVTVFLGIAAVLALLVTVGSGPPKRPAEVPGVFKHSNADIDQFSFIQTKDGERQWKVQARRARIMDKDSQAILEDLEVTLFGGQGTQMILKGDEGVVDTESHDLTIQKRTGLIPIRLESGYTILTNHLQWRNRDQEIYTDAPVVIQGDGIEITGSGLRGTLGTETFTITKDVRAVVTN